MTPSVIPLALSGQTSAHRGVRAETAGRRTRGSAAARHPQTNHSEEEQAMNTVPYTNARREGRTHPGLIEIISPEDPRHPMNGPRLVPNRADLRARGQRRGATRKGASSLKVARSEWPPKPTDAERVALSDYQWRRWAERSKRFASAFYRCGCGFETWGPGGAEHYEAIEAHEAMCDWTYADEAVSA